MCASVWVCVILSKTRFKFQTEWIRCVCVWIVFVNRNKRNDHALVKIECDRTIHVRAQTNQVMNTMWMALWAIAIFLHKTLCVGSFSSSIFEQRLRWREKKKQQRTVFFAVMKCAHHISSVYLRVFFKQWCIQCQWIHINAMEIVRHSGSLTHNWMKRWKSRCVFFFVNYSRVIYYHQIEALRIPMRIFLVYGEKKNVYNRSLYSLSVSRAINRRKFHRNLISRKSFQFSFVSIWMWCDEWKWRSYATRQYHTQPIKHKLIYFYEIKRTKHSNKSNNFFCLRNSFSFRVFFWGFYTFFF